MCHMKTHLKYLNLTNNLDSKSVLAFGLGFSETDWYNNMNRKDNNSTTFVSSESGVSMVESDCQVSLCSSPSGDRYVN